MHSRLICCTVVPKLPPTDPGQKAAAKPWPFGPVVISLVASGMRPWKIGFTIEPTRSMRTSIPGAEA
jgi:hypothetical protein